MISPFSLTFPRFDSHRTNPRIVNLLLALAPEQVLLEPPESESSRDKERQTSTYLIVSCHIFIPLHTQTGVKFEMGNITDLFWEQRPRLGCAGALFFKFYFDARAQSSSAIGLALNPHTHRHTHTLVCISGLFGSASLLAFQVECLYSASASKRRPSMSSVLRHYQKGNDTSTTGPHDYSKLFDIIRYIYMHIYIYL